MNTIPVPVVPLLVQAAFMEALKTLLEKKNLYQSVEANFKEAGEKYAESIGEAEDRPYPRAMATVIGSSSPSPEQHWEAQLRKYTNAKLIVHVPHLQKPLPLGHVQHDITPIQFDLPTILINCTNCKNVLPAHNPGYEGMREQTKTLNFKITDKGAVQVFTFPFQCQSCKSDRKNEPVVFTVRRVGAKLTLVGRSQLYIPTIPKSIPEEYGEFYGEAIVAKMAGKTLAGIFMLRVFVDQYMRKALAITGRKTGDEMGDAYAKLLDPEFPKRFASLKAIYGSLSEAIHEANGDPAIFEKNRDDIEKHFDLIKSMPLIKSRKEEKA